MTYDPTHIALMLAYEEACDRYFDAQADYRNCSERADFTRYYTPMEQARDEARAARTALADYRKEQGDE